MFLVVCFLLVGCSKSKVPIDNDDPAQIDLTGSLDKCYIHKDYVACTLSDGNTYFASMSKIMSVTRWDKTMWAEEKNKSGG